MMRSEPLFPPISNLHWFSNGTHLPGDLPLDQAHLIRLRETRLVDKHSGPNLERRDLVPQHTQGVLVRPVVEAVPEQVHVGPADHILLLEDADRYRHAEVASQVGLGQTAALGKHGIRDRLGEADVLGDAEAYIACMVALRAGWILI